MGQGWPSCLRREDSPPLKCLSLPHGPKQPFQEKLNPVQAHRPPRSVPSPPPCPQARAPGSPGDGSSEGPQHHPRPQTWSCCRVSARRRLHSWLCLEARLAAPTTSAMPRSSGWAAAPPRTPTQGQRAALQPPQSRCCPAAEGLVRSHRGWLPSRKAAGLALRWTVLYYCEVLFMKNLEGESARPREMVVVFLSLPSFQQDTTSLGRSPPHPGHPHVCFSPPPEPCPPCLPTSPGPEQTSMGPCEGME